MADIFGKPAPDLAAIYRQFNNAKLEKELAAAYKENRRLQRELYAAQAALSALEKVLEGGADGTFV